MCLAIAPDQKLNNGLFSRSWRIVSSTPLRLFWFCAFIHSLVLGALFVNNISAGVHIDSHAFTFGFSYGILALLVFGYLLAWLPKKYSLSPIHYGRYNAIYLLMMLGLGTLEAGIFFSNNLVIAGMLLFIPTWLIAIKSLSDIHIWLNRDAQNISRILMLILAINFISLALSILAWFYSLSEPGILATSFSIFFIWPSLVIAALVLLLNAPADGRIISP
jgi:hypothetical protein